MTLDNANKDIQAQLKIALQDETRAEKLDNLAAALLGRLLAVPVAAVPVAVAKSRFQYGGNAGPAGRQDRRFCVECKKYGDYTTLALLD